MSENKDTNCCIAKTLCIIAELQNNAEKFECCSSTCDRRFLGNTATSTYCYNTRPVSFYNCQGTLITLPYTLNGETGSSTVFRVEKVDGCCCSCRILANNPDESSELPFVDTNNFFTINTECICILKCSADTYIPCI